MSEEWVALVGLTYPDGDKEYEKALDGKPYKVRVAAPGKPCKNLPAKSVEAYLAMERLVIEPNRPESPDSAQGGEA
jgi:hypothetical protein